MFDETFWVAVAFAGFIGVAIYFKLPGMLTKILDERAEKIRNELDEAQRLREEAQALFAEYQRKTRNAAQEADDIVTHAQAEAKRHAEQASKDLAELMERRTVQAEQKIAQAEAQAIQDVRAAAVDLAVNAARRVMQEDLADDKADALVETAISDLRTKLH
jgi:F-type H+-transporting ATPase subunit b